MRVLWSTSRDVYENLAAEEWLLDRIAQEGSILLFYVNTDSIVVGKNQNPWRESATGWARRAGVPIARRISGGGAVWHDGGNLNFSLVLPRAHYNQARVFEQTRRALSDLGVHALLRDGNSLVVDGLKVSGTAFCFRGAAALHHGTLLVRSALDRLRAAMIPALPELETRAVASRPAAVLNLAERNPSLTLERAARAIARHLTGADRWVEWSWDSNDKKDRTAWHRSWSWVFGHTPSFSWKLAPDGPRVFVEHGHITGLEAHDGEALAWTPVPFERDALASGLAAYADAWSRAIRARDW